MLSPSLHESIIFQISEFGSIRAGAVGGKILSGTRGVDEGKTKIGRLVGALRVACSDR